MHIRLAQLDELPILENLARQIWPATYADIISQEQIDFMLNWMYSFTALRQQQEEGHEFYILHHEGQDIGFIAIEWINEPQQSDSAQLKINKLYVLRECQGKGMGRALFEKAKERATETGCKAIFLQVNKANQAKNFYLQLGFQVREEAVFDIGNGFVMDDYIMALAL
ncbi:MAG: GNAT family N-acetyltransferase [Flavobacteriia bacterium]|jgi:GNAT superfamily N-acetyltransferase